MSRAIEAPSPPGGWPDNFVTGRADRDALLVLAYLEGMSPADGHRLAWQEGTASACLRAVRAGAARGPSARDRVVADEVGPGTVRAALAASGARLVAPGDHEYPRGLLDLTDPPMGLFVRGTLPGPRPAVAMVGARRCTAYGREAAETIAEGLVTHGVTIVSGAAVGIDAAAHRGALRGGGPTIAVLGSGIDVAYPPRNAALIDGITRAGAVVSEYPPGIEARPHRFPARNRLVAALGQGVIVVEGAPGSGSLITVEFAGDLGRDVMAVPGAISGPLSDVPHALIRDGAALIRGPGDVVETLGLAPSPSVGSPQGPGDLAALLSDDERRFLERVPGTPATLDSVARSAGVDPACALGLLGALELRGLVASDGGRYRRAGPG
ncbi:MAG TPA: DNA-processing protein DprA [Actinomycetota bacterium]|nr:DNA-processing protein DprA [Actinomycetota bacterium]